MAREVIRHVQQSRKDADLQMEDRIVLYLGTESANLAAAIVTHRDYIAAETLVAKWSMEPLGDAPFRVEVKVDGQGLVIELQEELNSRFAFLSSSRNHQLAAQNIVGIILHPLILPAIRHERRSSLC